MLVEQGGAADEGGGDSPSSSAFLQLVGVLRRGRCGRAAAATGRGGQTGGTRGRLRLVGLFRLDPGQPKHGGSEECPGAVIVAISAAAQSCTAEIRGVKALFVICTCGTINFWKSGGATRKMQKILSQSDER